MEYEFVDQNVSETQIGPYTIRTMSIRLGEETKLVQAVAVPSLFGTYYLFPSLQKKNCMRTTYSIADKSYTYKIMWIDLNGGLLIHVVANQEYEYNGEGKSVSTYGEDYNADKPDLEHCQYFWLSNDRMPEQFILTGQDSQTDFILGLADMGYPKY